MVIRSVDFPSRKMNQMLIAFVISLLVGCASTNDAAVALNSDFLGKNIDTFVVQYGAPYQKFQMNNGDILYTWRSGTNSFTLPSTTNVQGTASPYGYSATGTTTGGGTLNVFCEVQIVTAPDGTIQSIRPIRDTIGLWAISRCAEIFKQ